MIDEKQNYDFEDDSQDFSLSDEKPAEEVTIDHDTMMESHEEMEDDDLYEKMSEPGGIAGLVEKFKDGWVTYSIIIVVIIAGIFILRALFSGGSSQQVAQQQQSQSPVGNLSNEAGYGAIQVKSAQKKPAHAAAAPSSVTVTNEDMRKLLEGFNGVVNRNTKHIYKSINEQDELIHKLIAEYQASNSGKAANTVLKQLSDVMSQFSRLSKDIGQLRGELANVNAQLRLLGAKQAASAGNLTLRAIVPGRAWLVDSDGKTVTVTVGSTLANFGKVVSIDADNGVVRMSSGYVFN